MKIINATWEKRNFNMDSFEITLNKKDLNNFDETLVKIKEQNFKNAYVIIKMPVGNLKALHTFEDLGYRFLETQFKLVEKFEPRTDIFQSTIGNQDINQDTNYTIAIVPKVKEEWEKVIQKLTPGMFDTDRVSLDPFLGEEIACKRYQNWCRDLFENPDSYMFVRKIDDVEYGFGIEIVDKETNETNSIIGGIFKEFKDMGLGVTCLNDRKNKNVKDGKDEFRTSVSSNNLPILKIHQLCGRIIYKEQYVLRKIYE